MLPQQCIPSPVGEGASLKLLSGLHSHAATVHQDVQMSSYTHPNRKEAGGQHSSDQLMTRQSSRKLQKIDSHITRYRYCSVTVKLYSCTATLLCTTIFSPIKHVTILYMYVSFQLIIIILSVLLYLSNFCSCYFNFTHRGYTHFCKMTRELLVSTRHLPGQVHRLPQ